MKHEPIEPVLLMLCGMIVFFTLLLFASEKFFGTDGQIFQVVANLLSGFGGALLMRVKPRNNETGDPPTTAQITTKTTVQEASSEPTKP